jgi:hypothetical protein
MPAQAAAPAADAAPKPDVQVADAVVRLLGGGAGHQVTISLAPHELGQVDISIARHATGGATVTVTVERPDTLDLLRHDKPQLQSALERAGMSVAAGDVTLHLTAAPAHSVAAPGPAAAPPQSDRADAPPAAPGGQPASNGDRPQGQQPGHGQRRPATTGWLVDGPPMAAGTPAGNADGRLHDGLDITA